MLHTVNNIVLTMNVTKSKRHGRNQVEFVKQNLSDLFSVRSKTFLPLRFISVLVQNVLHMTLQLEVLVFCILPLTPECPSS